MWAKDREAEFEKLREKNRKREQRRLEQIEDVRFNDRLRFQAYGRRGTPHRIWTEPEKRSDVGSSFQEWDRAGLYEFGAIPRSGRVPPHKVEM